MGALLAISVSFKTLECGVAGCGMQFALTESFYRWRLEDGKQFYCPNGHHIHFFDSENAKLKRELEAEKAKLQGARNETDWVRKQRDRADRKAAAARGQVTKIKNRVGNGVCPCCNRTFQNLMRHMAHKHPDFKKEEKDGKV